MVSRAGTGQVQPAYVTAVEWARAKRDHVLQADDVTALNEESEVPTPVTVGSQVFLIL